MRRARLAELIAALAITTSACSLLTSLDGLSSPPGTGPTNGDARADGELQGSGEASADGSSTGDALDASDDAGTNLHPQPTFENGTCAPWVGYQGTVEVVPTAHSGQGACRVCTKPTTTNFFTADDNRSPGPSVLGATYHAEAWVRNDPSAPAPPSVTLYLRNATIVNGNFIDLESSSSPTTAIGATWRRFDANLTFTKPGDLNVFISADTAPNACFLLDDVVLQRIE
jgi:hypothetical protein